MKNKNEIIKQQKEFINEMKTAASNFIASINKADLQTILLSGSVARGDYFPKKKENGEYIGDVDLIIMRKPGSNVTAEDLFGPNQDPGIPYHCVKIDKVWFAIWFVDFINVEQFSHYDEARKFSILEAEILYDEDKLYETELAKINQLKIEECQKELQKSIS